MSDVYGKDGIVDEGVTRDDGGRFRRDDSALRDAILMVAIEVSNLASVVMYAAIDANVREDTCRAIRANLAGVIATLPKIDAGKDSRDE